MGALFHTFSKRVGLPAPVVARIECERDVRIPLADGVETLADHWKPVDVADAPLVLIRSPYGRKLMNLLVCRTLAYQGFQVLIQASRGTDGSQGTFDDPFGCEIADGKATVEWLVEQPFYPGRFFTFGDSYLGYTQLALAQSAGAHLAGSVLRVAPSSVREMVWPGGALFQKAILSWSLMASVDPRLGLRSIIRDRRLAAPLDKAGLTGAVLPSYQQVSGGPIGFLDAWLGHPTNDDGWWDRFEVGGALDEITCPVLVQGGWYDLFLDDSLQQYQRLAARGVPVELMLGPWTHGDMLAKGLGASVSDAIAFLRDVAGLAPRPAGTKPVRLIEINSKATLAYDGWPGSPDDVLSWSLADLTADGPSTFTYDPADPTPRVGGASNDLDSGRKDNTDLEKRADVLTWTSQPLAGQTHLLGSPSVQLDLASDRTDTAVFVRLCEVDAKGRSWNITDRLVLLRAADRGADGSWQLTVALPPTCLSVPAGHRLRLQVSGGAYPRFARHPGTAESPATASGHVAATQTVRSGSLSSPLRPVSSSAELRLEARA